MADKEKSVVDVEAAEISHDQATPSQIASKTTDKWWIMEFLALFASLLALLAIVILLICYHDRPSPYSLIGKKVAWSFRGYEGEFGVHFSINSYISIFSTIFKTCLAVPVAAALGQLKWTWFRQDRPLSDYALIDKATRGTSGSLLLIWKLRAKHLLSMGAFLTVAALVLDFGFQSMVQYPLLPAIVSDATLPRTQGYSSIAAHGNSAGVQPNTDMLTALLSGLYGSNSTDSSRYVSPNCATGNCSWPQYTSLAICSQCADVTSQVRQNCSVGSLDGTNDTHPYCDYTLPNNSTGTPDYDYGLSIYGLFNVFGSGPTTVNLSAFLIDPRSPAGMQSVFAVLNVLQGNWNSTGITTLEGVKATQCALSFCVNRYSGFVVNSTFHETIVNTFHNNSATYPLNEDGSSSNLPFVTKPDQEFIKGISNTTEEYVASFQVGKAIGLKLQSIWNGSAFGPGKALDTSDCASLVSPLNFEGIVNVTNSLATSITSAMRNQGDEQDISNSNSDVKVRVVYGTGSQYIPYVVVEWRWLVLPASLLLLTLIFVLLTMKVSGDGTLWKDASLAVFYQSLTGDARDALQSAQSKDQLGEIADDLKVKWVQTEKGWRLAKTRDS